MSDCCNCPLRDLDDGCTSDCVNEAFYKKGREDAINEFVKRIEEHQQQNWIENLEYGITFADIEAVANEMREQKNGNK